MSKADNMLSILWLLRSGKRMTAKQLADELEIHVRTVYRCIDSLCAGGVPVIADSGPNGGYRILERFAEAPLVFDLAEQKALMHASIFAQEAGYPFREELGRAVDKLKRYTNAEQLAHIERHSEGLSVIHPPVDGQLLHLLRILEESAAQGRAVQMDYANGRGQPISSRRLDPYGIVHWKGSWYAVGYCHLREDVRSFRVDRIARLEPGDGPFERPAAFSAKAFLLRGLLPGTGNDETLVGVVVRGHEQALDMLCRHWLFGHALAERGEGEASFQLDMASMHAYVPYFLLPYGTSITIVEPVSLIARMAQVSADIAAHYESMKAEHNNDRGEC